MANFLSLALSLSHASAKQAPPKAKGAANVANTPIMNAAGRVIKVGNKRGAESIPVEKSPVRKP